MHYMNRKVEGLEARQGDPAEPTSKPQEINLHEVEKRVTIIERRVDQLMVDYGKAERELKERKTRG